MRALTSLQQKQKALEDEMVEAAKRSVTLESATIAYLFSDCNETDSIINESITLAKSKVRDDLLKNACDYLDILGLGQDKLSALSLLQRHKYI